MAERRMFAKTIIDSDAFLEMPLSTQSLYFHLSMRADDEGFLNNPKKIQRMIGASEDDFKVLIAKNFIIPFDSGVVVIKHWKIHNYIRSDRLQQTQYQEEKQLLGLKENGAYTLSANLDVPSDVRQMSVKCPSNVRIGKDRVGKDSIGKGSIGESEGAQKYRYGIFNNVKLTEDELQTLIDEYPDSYQEKIENLSQYMKSKGTYYHDHFATIMKWAREDEAKKPQNKGADNLNQFYDMVRDWAQEGDTQ